MYCKQCGEQIANQKLPQCPGCGRRLTKEQQSYRGLLFHDLRRTAARKPAASREFRRRDQKDRRLENHFDVLPNPSSIGMMTDAIRKLERYREKQKAAPSENQHGSSIVDPSEAKNAPPEKIQ